MLMPFRSPFNKYYTEIYRPALEEIGCEVLSVDGA